MIKKPIISIIVAHDEKRAIGKNNGLLWHIPEDLKHFKEITTGHTVIMGRKTYESIGRPLPNRENIVISRNGIKIDGCQVVDSLDKAINIAAKVNQEEIFIIGGGSIYAQALPKADKLYITKVYGNHEADVFFPQYESEFSLVSESAEYQTGQYRFKFMELVRI